MINSNIFCNFEGTSCNFLVANQDRTIKTIIDIQSITVEFFNSYPKGLKIVSAAIDIKGRGPLKNPNPKLAPKAPPKTETTNIIKTRADKIIDLELNI